MKAPRPTAWTKTFDRPIDLKDRGAIATLADARAFMVDLPMGRTTGTLYWQYAAELLIKAAENDKRADIDKAGDQFARAASADNLDGARTDPGRPSETGRE